MRNAFKRGLLPYRVEWRASGGDPWTRIVDSKNMTIASVEAQDWVKSNGGEVRVIKQRVVLEYA